MGHSIRESDATIVARDGYPLAATVIAPEAPPPGSPLVIFGSATAVPRAYYRTFAGLLAERGHPTIQFDYRGVAGSAPKPPLTLRNFPHRNRIWGTIDIPSVIDWARQTFPDRPVHWVGHSFGGFGFGLADNNHLITRTLNVATPFSYWGQMDGAEKYKIALQAYVAMPAAATLVGKLPGWTLGGADLPAAVSREWAQWLRTPDMFFSDATLPETKNFANVRADMLFLRITDDPWATDQGAQLWKDRFSQSRVTIERIRPEDANVKAIGHIPFFKPRFKDTLWPRALDWITAEGNAR
jgi:predicted alpha/beta hydrolase